MQMYLERSLRSLMTWLLVINMSLPTKKPLASLSATFILHTAAFSLLPCRRKDTGSSDLSPLPVSLSRTSLQLSRVHANVFFRQLVCSRVKLSFVENAIQMCRRAMKIRQLPNKLCSTWVQL
eukprot:TRINITY_DN2783_c1_g1_i2.p1 TRINITY_DN2783_c1_g1~~TRINITY_DN2783_c1_g1_i2.p1  ORF type:complete len:122 (-),score=9.25 TRINITY_DN2783_c1_g1_i2:271-636(-)